MNLTEFLAREGRQELRFEFDGFQSVAMTGGTFAHDRITFNMRKALDLRLGGKPCRPAGPLVKFLTRGTARYPDGLVTCSSLKPDVKVIDRPLVVFDLIGGDTECTDRIEKVREYLAVVSIKRYVRARRVTSLLAMIKRAMTAANLTPAPAANLHLAGARSSPQPRRPTPPQRTACWPWCR